ncbi:MAG: helix-turn-helix transcriptional regulator [Bifidobacteriaceae bacterium]|nr:helix-turn-helix transcriptional regulator [Bifidobacteriaceae bacterium]
MVKRPSTLAVRDLARFGVNLANWRKIQRLTARMVAERAGISRDTLRAIEHGQGGVSIENVFRVLRVLGQSEAVIRAVDALNSDHGRLVAERALVSRVRTPK